MSSESQPLPPPLSGEVHAPEADAHLHHSGAAQLPSTSQMSSAGAPPLPTTDGQVSRNEKKKDLGNTLTIPELPDNLNADRKLSVAASGNVRLFRHSFCLN